MTSAKIHLFSERKQKESSFILKLVIRKQNVKGMTFPVLWLSFVLFNFFWWVGASNEYQDCFNKIGQLLRNRYHIEPIDNQTPVVYPPSTVPVHLPQEGRSR